MDAALDALRPAVVDLGLALRGGLSASPDRFKQQLINLGQAVKALQTCADGDGSFSCDDLTAACRVVLVGATRLLGMAVGGSSLEGGEGGKQRESVVQALQSFVVEYQKALMHRAGLSNANNDLPATPAAPPLPVASSSPAPAPPTSSATSEESLQTAERALERKRLAAEELERQRIRAQLAEQEAIRLEQEAERLAQEAQALEDAQRQQQEEDNRERMAAQLADAQNRAKKQLEAAIGEYHSAAAAAVNDLDIAKEEAIEQKTFLTAAALAKLARAVEKDAEGVALLDDHSAVASATEAFKAGWFARLQESLVEGARKQVQSDRAAAKGIQAHAMLFLTSPNPSLEGFRDLINTVENAEKARRSAEIDRMVKLRRHEKQLAEKQGVAQQRETERAKMLSDHQQELAELRAQAAATRRELLLQLDANRESAITTAQRQVADQARADAERERQAVQRKQKQAQAQKEADAKAKQTAAAAASAAKAKEEAERRAADAERARKVANERKAAELQAQQETAAASAETGGDMSDMSMLDDILAGMGLPANPATAMSSSSKRRTTKSANNQEAKTRATPAARQPTPDPDLVPYEEGGELVRRVINTKTLPLVVLRTVSWFDADIARIQISGLFRESANARVLKQMREEYAKGKDPSFDGVDIHTIAGLLKAHFRYMDEPLIPRSIQSSLYKQSTSRDVYGMAHTLRKMDDDSLNQLQYVVEFLARVAFQQEHNLMDSKNIGICIGPAITQGVATAASIIMVMVEHWDVMFGLNV